MQVGRAVGMVTLNDALMDLVNKKLVTPEEAYAKAVDKATIPTALKKFGFDPAQPAQPATAPAAAGAAPTGPQRPAAAGGTK